MTEQHPQRQFTRGGQIIMHNIRMFSQVMKVVLLCVVVIFIVVVWLGYQSVVSVDDRVVYALHFKAKAVSWFEPSRLISAKLPHQETQYIPANRVLNNPNIRQVVRHVDQQVISIASVGGFTMVISWIIISSWFRRRGKKAAKDTLLRGDEFATPKIIKKQLQREKRCSDLNIGGLSFVKDTEKQHVLVDGTVGVGKSQAIKQLLDQIRRRGDLAIVYDKGGDFIREFYREGEDRILNPMDDRTVGFHLWSECRSLVDFDNFAVAQIPLGSQGGDPFWVLAARSIFANSAYAMRDDPERSMLKLLRLILTLSLEDMHQFLKGTLAESLVSKKIEKTAVSIKAVLATYLKGLLYVKDTQDAFSVRNWLQSADSTGWIFASSVGNVHEMLRPFLTAWLDIVITSLLSLPSDPNRRIWLILDEVPSLNRLPYLEQGLAEARKFGGCFVLGWQNISQLRHIYGIEGAKSISSLLNTRFFYRQPDPEIAGWSARNLGAQVLETVQENISYGANTLRDGVSLQRSERKKQLVEASDIMRLPDLSCYARLPGAWPVCPLQLRYQHRDIRHEPFVARELPASLLVEEVETLMQQVEKHVSHDVGKKPVEQTLSSAALSELDDLFA